MLKVIQRETGEWDILMDQETFTKYMRVEYQKGYDTGATEAYENAAAIRKLEAARDEYRVIVRYERKGEVYHDLCFSRCKTRKEAIDAVKHMWHSYNDSIFIEAQNAEFFINVDDIDGTR